jgi:phosphatidylserine/phosphatidylglycerophosphate/cardiolipin synthase-like enzyme
MSTREDLHDKWFIDLSSEDSSLPPKRRYSGSEVEDSNQATVHSRLEGAGYMDEWCQGINDMINDTSDSRLILHAGWKLGNIETRPGDPTSKSLDILKIADEQGVGVHIALGGQLLGKEANEESVSALGFDTAAIDSRYPTFGSNHMKYTLFLSAVKKFGLVGSIDINKSMWGAEPHKPNDPGLFGGPIHNLGVKLTGPVLQDIFLAFKERWNDDSRDEFKRRTPQDLKGAVENIGSAQVPDDWTLLKLAAAGWKTVPPKLHTEMSWSTSGNEKHDVQVLRTFGRGRDSPAIPGTPGYTWTDEGEYTIWASYLNATQTADEYIYIEDQHFIPFGFPLWCDRDWKFRQVTPFYQLKNALQRGVDVLVVTDKRIGSSTNMRYNHIKGVEYLLKHAENARGDFRIAHLHNGDRRIGLHSKLMIVDDELVLLGSANFSRRSFTNDGELNLAIIDEGNDFAADTRQSLWSEHLQSPVGTALDTARSTFKRGIREETGHLVDHSSIGWKPSRPSNQKFWLRIADPYGGPPPGDFLN